MRNEPSFNIERMQGLLWRAAAESVPDWLPMRHVEGLAEAVRAEGLLVQGGH